MPIPMVLTFFATTIVAMTHFWVQWKARFDLVPLWFSLALFYFHFASGAAWPLYYVGYETLASVMSVGVLLVGISTLAIMIRIDRDRARQRVMAQVAEVVVSNTASTVDPSTVDPSVFAKEILRSMQMVSKQYGIIPLRDLAWQADNILISLIAPDGEVLLHEGGLLRRAGLNPGQVTGHTIDNLSVDEFRSPIKSALRGVCEDRQPAVQEVLWGGRTFLLYHTPWYDGAGRLNSMLTIVMDMTHCAHLTTSAYGLDDVPTILGGTASQDSTPHLIAR